MEILRRSNKSTIILLMSRNKAYHFCLALVVISVLASLNSEQSRGQAVTVLQGALSKMMGELDARGDVSGYKSMTSTYELDYIPEHIAMNFSMCTDVRRAPDLDQSRMSIQNSRTSFELGDIMNVNIQLINGYGKPLTTGGAVIRPRMFNLTKRAYATAPVTDHGNGSYTARFEALWSGTSTITAKVAYVPATIRAIYNFRLQLPSTVEIEGLFSVDNITEKTLCHPTKKALEKEYSQICNLTYDNSGMPWFCGKPKTVQLLCEDWTGSNYRLPLPQLSRTPCEKALLERSIKDMRATIKVNTKDGTGPDSTIIQLPKTPCKTFNTTQLWAWKQTTGFMYENKWHLRHCKGYVERSLFSCLRNNKFLLFGDSTVRQWYQHIVKRWNCSATSQKWTKVKWHKRTACANTEHNFTVQWLPHSQPFFGADTNRYTTSSISRHLEETGSDERVVALIHVFLHPLPYHASVFKEKIRRIRISVEHLIERNKFVKILIKAPHTFYSSVAFGRERLSDYFGLLYKHIMYEEFRGLHDKIIYLDHTDSTDALATDNVHPPENVVAGMVEQMLAYIC